MFANGSVVLRRLEPGFGDENGAPVIDGVTDKFAYGFVVVPVGGPNGEDGKVWMGDEVRPVVIGDWKVA